MRERDDVAACHSFIVFVASGRKGTNERRRRKAESKNRTANSRTGPPPHRTFFLFQCFDYLEVKGRAYCETRRVEETWRRRKIREIFAETGSGVEYKTISSFISYFSILDPLPALSTRRFPIIKRDFEILIEILMKVVFPTQYPS